MLHIKLSDRRPARPDDPMTRDWWGYDPTAPVDGLFARNRGRWHLGPRADREKYAAFSYTGDHKIKFIAEIEAIERELTKDARLLVTCSTRTTRCPTAGSTHQRLTRSVTRLRTSANRTVLRGLALAGAKSVSPRTDRSSLGTTRRRFTRASPDSGAGRSPSSTDSTPVIRKPVSTHAEVRQVRGAHSSGAGSSAPSRDPKVRALFGLNAFRDGSGWTVGMPTA